MNREINRLGAEFVVELSKCAPQDYLEIKLMMLAYPRNETAKKFLNKLFALADERRPLLLTVK